MAGWSAVCRPGKSRRIYLFCPFFVYWRLTSVGDNIWIIPLLCVSHDDNHNVMRGEERQSIGARVWLLSSLYVMPGTHCKWVQADSQQFTNFAP
ncbi:2-dehydro-3-deoxygalactonokinase [Shigella flexneri]